MADEKIEMNIIERTLDVIPSPVDDRDWIAENLLTIVKFPATLDLRGLCRPIRNQGSQGSCAAMAGSAMKEAHEYSDYQLREYLSPQYIYNLRANKPSEGMYMRDLMKILTSNGVCREVTYPYMSTGPITTAMNTEAAKFKIKGYAASSTIDGLKLALYTNGPAVIAFPVYNYGTEFWYQKVGETMKGGHAVTVVGYNEIGFIIRNSWGTDWGNAGYTVFPYAHWGKQWEVWSTIDIKTGPNKPAPKPSNNALAIIGRVIKRFFGLRGSRVAGSCKCAAVKKYND